MQEGAVVDALGDAVAGSQAMKDLVEEHISSRTEIGPTAAANRRKT
jgi:hypothetical protein